MSSNRYAGPCQRCGATVEAGSGYVVNLNKWSSARSREAARWAIYCGDKAECVARVETAAAEAAASPAAVAAREAVEAKHAALVVAASAVVAALQEIEPAVPVYDGKARTYTLPDGAVLKVTKRRDGGYNIDGWSGWGTYSLPETQAFLAEQWVNQTPAFEGVAGHVALGVRVQRVREAAVAKVTADA